MHGYGECCNRAELLIENNKTRDNTLTAERGRKLNGNGIYEHDRNGALLITLRRMLGCPPLPRVRKVQCPVDQAFCFPP
jgi:hypothetical protein